MIHIQMKTNNYLVILLLFSFKGACPFYELGEIVNQNTIANGGLPAYVVSWNILCASSFFLV